MKKSLVAAERGRAKARRQRRLVCSSAASDRATARTHRVIAASSDCRATDDAAVKTTLTRLRGRSLRGQRPKMDALFGSWGTQTLIAGLTYEALIAPCVMKGAVDGPAFAACEREVLVPEIEPGPVVIPDNLATQETKEASDALRAHGRRFLFLLPYSPDLNPIKQAFTKLKAHTRRIGAKTFTDMFEAVGKNL